MKNRLTGRVTASLAGGLLLGAGGFLVEGVPAGGWARMVVATDDNAATVRPTPMPIEMRPPEQLYESDLETSAGGEDRSGSEGR